MKNQMQDHDTSLRHDWRVWVPALVLAVVGVALIVVPFVRTVTTVEVSGGTDITIDCGNAYKAKNFDPDINTRIEITGGDVSDPNAGTAVSGLDDDCRSEGNKRVLTFAVFGPLGAVFLVGAGILFWRTPQFVRRFLH